MTKTAKIHYMGTEFARSTACGKFVDGTRSNDPQWTATDEDVTCGRCRAVTQTSRRPSS